MQASIFFQSAFALLLALQASACASEDEPAATTREQEPAEKLADASVNSDPRGEPQRDASRANVAIDAALRTVDAAPPLRPDASTSLVDAAISLDAGKDGASPLQLTSTVVNDGARLPNEHRCAADRSGPGSSPPLSWTAGPSGTQSYAIVLLDVTNASRTVTHWLLYDLPATTTSLPQGVPVGASLTTPVSAKQGPNYYMRERGYRGPCAPTGTNRYEFTLYSLDVAELPELGANPTPAQITAQLTMHQLASTKLTVTSSAQ